MGCEFVEMYYMFLYTYIYYGLMGYAISLHSNTLLQRAERWNVVYPNTNKAN